MKPVPCLCLAALLFVTGCGVISPRINSDAEELTTHLHDMRADAPGILETIEQSPIEPVEDDRNLTTARLMEERDELEGRLVNLRMRPNITWKPDADAAMTLYYASRERQKIWMEIMTLRFQVALEDFLLERARNKSENRPNKLQEDTDRKPADPQR